MAFPEDWRKKYACAEKSALDNFERWALKWSLINGYLINGYLINGYAFIIFKKKKSTLLASFHNIKTGREEKAYVVKMPVYSSLLIY